jgi:hypothetical protein
LAALSDTKPANSTNRTGKQGMVKTIKMNDRQYQVSDSQVYFGHNLDGSWQVYDAKRDCMVAVDLDDYEWAESVAFQYVCQVA